MTQEDKKLLLKVFSTMLHYGLIVSPTDCGNARLVGCLLDSVLLQDIRTGKDYDKPWDIEYVKPYLRPMSSMTEVEKHIFDTMTRGYTIHQQATLFDWLNAHYFDYRGLIPMGLAIEVTKENNPYEY